MDSQDVIVFDVLKGRSSEIIGETKEIKVKVPVESFRTPNARGSFRDIASLDDIGRLGKERAKKLLDLVS